MKITEEMARQLDTILSSASEKQRVVTLPDTANKDMCITLGNILKERNLGKWLGGNAFMIFPEGLVFSQNDSFLERLRLTNEKISKEEEIQELNLQLTKNQLAEIKRNHRLSVASIIIAIIALIISLFQLIYS